MNIMKFKPLFFTISLFFLVPGIFFLLRFGLKPAIDFTGGSLLEIKAEGLVDDKESISEQVGDIYEISLVQSSGDNQIIIRGKNIGNEVKEEVLIKLSEKYGEIEELRFETVGPTLGKELLMKTFAAIVIVSGLITLYVWKQFNDFRFGVSAILAMFHDSLILLGAFSVLGHFYHVEVDVLFVTALLTTLSFSVHDTIVVFDRIRELRNKNYKSSLTEIVNMAVIETLSRSINNSVTIIIMLLALVLIGGESIKWFSVALLIGAVTGTYSSTFTAAPLILLWEDISNKRKNR
ncbi:MAG: protein translocase subunit SecF [Candidatus Pacebacteria bacterium]|nr:protein translocase subunit SecF [Candidatus Paceibacterota bacterium]